MMIIMQRGATQKQVDHVVEHIEKNNLSAHTSIGVNQTVIGVVGESHSVSPHVFETLPGVQAVQRISQPYKLASRQFHPENSIFPLDGFTIGGDEIPIIAGPCSVESQSQIIEVAKTIVETGANALRGGVFKPRSSPYSFQGLGEEGLKYLSEARELTGLPIVVEVMAVSQVCSPPLCRARLAPRPSAPGPAAPKSGCLPAASSSTRTGSRSRGRSGR